ncbi:DUF945 family protein [Salinisphaera sp. SPP-AMP-43]|uniref:DUF945 family protein n=1 Tax=Salinisphaera sp. SPP-AMP-43 TaxID=3121288 RepID=UPI003C6DD170
MAKQFVFGAVAIVGVAVGAAVVAPYFIGQSIEARFRAQVGALDQRLGIPLRVAEYHRHWFSAEATIETMVDKQQITLHSDIRHGPLPGFNLATIDTRWAPDDLNITYDQAEPLLNARTEVGFSSSTTTSLHAAPFEGSGQAADGKPVQVAWQGMDGELWTDDQQHLQLTSPGLRVRHDGVVQGFKDLSVQAQGAQLPGEKIEELRARDLVGHSDIQFGQVFFQSPDTPQRITFGAALKGRATSSKANRWGFHTALTLHDLVLPNDQSSASALKVHELTLETAIDALNAQQLVALLSAVRPYQQQLAGASKAEVKRLNKQIGQMVIKRLPEVLTDDSALHIGLSSLATNRGSAAIDLTASLHSGSEQANPQRVSGLASLVRRAFVEASAEVDKPLLQWLLAQSDDPTKGRRTLAGLAQKGLIDKQQAQFKSSFYMDSNTMRINGQKLPDRMRRLLLMSILAASQH